MTPADPKRPRGRPRLQAPAVDSLTLRIPTALRARLDARAERDGATTGATVRAAIEAYLASQ